MPAPGETLASLRDHLDRNPDDRQARLRLAGLLVTHGERAAARALLQTLEPEAEATAELAALDEAEGLTGAAIARWERLLADDIDHPEAQAQVTKLRRYAPHPSTLPATPTLVSPEGVHLPRYQLVREIGRGATATVYLAHDEALGLDLALKVLHPQLAGSLRSEVCRRFFQEARMAAGLRHPGVVAIYDLDEAARTLVMEYVRGGSLRDRLRAGTPIEAPEVRAIADRLLETLAFVHTRGVLHGDITPRNVLLREAGVPVLADFGNARLLEGAATDTPAGTPAYLAPEQLRGAPPSPATDRFAVGAILWELLAGRPARDHAALISGRLECPPLPDVDRSLATLIARLTALEPSERKL